MKAVTEVDFVAVVEVDFVVAAARAAGGRRPCERWVKAAEGRAPLEETIGEYFTGHDPFPAGSEVEVWQGQGWEASLWSALDSTSGSSSSAMAPRRGATTMSSARRPDIRRG